MPSAGALSGGPSASISYGNGVLDQLLLAVRHAERRADGARPALEELAGQQHLAEVLMNVARAPLVADQIVPRRLRDIALAERIERYAAADGVVQTHGREQRLAELVGPAGDGRRQLRAVSD